MRSWWSVVLVLVTNTHRSMNDNLPDYDDQTALSHGNAEYDIVDVTTTLTPEDKERICGQSKSAGAVSAIIVMTQLASGDKNLQCGSPNAFNIEYDTRVHDTKGKGCTIQEIFIVCNRENMYARWLAVALWNSDEVSKPMVDCVVKTCFPEMRKKNKMAGTITSNMIATNSNSAFRYTSPTTTAMVTAATGSGMRNASFEIADEDLQLIRSKYYELINREEEEESMLMVLIIIATVFYAIFGVIAGYESVALLICEARKKLRSKSSSRPSKNKNVPLKNLNSLNKDFKYYEWLVAPGLYCLVEKVLRFMKTELSGKTELFTHHRDFCMTVGWAVGRSPRLTLQSTCRSTWNLFTGQKMRGACFCALVVPAAVYLSLRGMPLLSSS